MRELNVGPWAEFERDEIRSANATIDSDRRVVPVDTSSSTVTITLGSEMVEEGAWLVVTDEGGNGATNAITVDTEGSETIDGATSASISGGYGQLRLYSDGQNWFTF